jgi:hypothetical protein
MACLGLACSEASIPKFALGRSGSVLYEVLIMGAGRLLFPIVSWPGLLESISTLLLQYIHTYIVRKFALGRSGSVLDEFLIMGAGRSLFPIVSWPGLLESIHAVHSCSKIRSIGRSGSVLYIRVLIMGCLFVVSDRVLAWLARIHASQKFALVYWTHHGVVTAFILTVFIYFKNLSYPINPLEFSTTKPPLDELLSTPYKISIRPTIT